MWLLGCTGSSNEDCPGAFLGWHRNHSAKGRRSDTGSFLLLWLIGCLLIPCKTDHFLYLLRLVICCSEGECIKNTQSFLNLTPETNMILSVNYLEFKYKLGKKLFKREIIYKYQNTGKLHWYVNFLTFSHQVILNRPLLTHTFFLMLILKLITIPFFLKNKY